MDTNTALAVAVIGCGLGIWGGLVGWMLLQPPHEQPAPGMSFDELYQPDPNDWKYGGQ